MKLNNTLYLASILSCSLAISSGICSAEQVQLSLDESISMALADDASIESADAQREAADHALKAARRNKGPIVSWNSQAYKIGGRNYQSANDAHDAYGDPHAGDYRPVYITESGLPRLGNPVTVGSYPYHNTFANSWKLTVPVYTGGQLEGQIAAARYRLNRADMERENMRQTVRYQAAEAYANLIYRENIAQIAQDAVDKGNTQLELIRAQFEEGAVAEADLLMMKVNIANYKQNLVTAEAAVAVAKSTLASVVGLPQDMDVEPSTVFSYEPYDKDLPACESYALAHRPDGLAAEYDIKAANAQMETAKSGYRPKVSAVATQNIASNYPFRSERSNAWEAGVNVSWNIFDNGITEANVRQADANIRAYEAKARQVKKNIQLDTRKAYLEMKAAEQNITETAAAVKQAQDSYTIAQVRYEEGVDVLLGVTDAQEKFIQARSNYITALYQYNLSQAKLEKAMGVPVAFDSQRYQAAEGEGASAEQALEEASVSQGLMEAEK
ncbi:TolC family protein [Selenomonas caprae]|uniref:TolC family protein n=1 Tax=Selenomonas caprae TaxID=2606905 RepID=A0A5D6WVA0_9FIRM|nr:TolC family protein [Selenomonas caprae]TYZ31099.1 TolC family protein [Selenomonas caprae]